MNNIKKFDIFVNEELEPDTYLRASKDLRALGHKSRANKLEDYYNKVSKRPKINVDDIEPAQITVDGKRYVVLPENIRVNTEDTMSGLDVYIDIILDGDITNPSIGEDIAIYMRIIQIGVSEYDISILNDSAKADDRKSAINIYRFLKKWAYTQKIDAISESISKQLTVNMLYKDK